jgi:hypothetical protein
MNEEDSCDGVVSFGGSSDISIDGCFCIFGVNFSLSESNDDWDFEKLECASQTCGDGISDEVDLNLGVVAGFCVTRFGFSNLDEKEGSVFISEFSALLRLVNLSLSDLVLDLVGK